MNSRNDRNLEFDDFGLDEYESPFGSCSYDDDWDEDEWEEGDDEPPRELTPKQIENINRNIQKILKEAKQKSKEICKGKIFTYRGIPLCKEKQRRNKLCLRK